MAEVGPVGFAGLVCSMAETVLPAHRTPWSNRLFTQPQLLAILCLMRYED